MLMPEVANATPEVATVAPRAAAKTKPTERRSKCASAFARSASRWVEDYVLEWQRTDSRNASKLKVRAAGLVEAINESDVVCFVKPGGLCPFCNLASKILLEYSVAEGAPPFALHIGDLLLEDREALRLMLGVPVLTWPVCFIRGVHLPGGGEAVARLKKEDQLHSAITAPLVSFAPPPLRPPQKEPWPLLLHQAGGGRWLGCQTRIYGNVLRGIAVLQICLLAPAYVLQRSGNTTATIPLLALLALDAFMFTAAGPTPWSPLGCLSTVLVWPRRGTVAPLLPYKFTMGALYFLLNVGTLACRLIDTAAASDDVDVGGASNSSGSNSSSTGAFCRLISSNGMVYSMLVNSTALAIFRF